MALKMLGHGSLSAKLGWHLNWGWYFVMVAVPIGFLIDRIWGRGFSLPFNVRLAPVPSKHYVTGGLFGSGHGWLRVDAVTVRFEDAPLFLHVIGAIVPALEWATLLVVIHQLRGVFGTLESGHPFNATNARRMRFIGLALLVSQAAIAIAMTALPSLAGPNLKTVGFILSSDLPLQPWVILAGLVLLVLGDAFRVGTDLHEEQKLTV